MSSPQFSLQSCIRANILKLQPYVCARDEYSAGVLLDANENSLGHSIPLDSASLSAFPDSVIANLNRYPSPTHDPIKDLLCPLRGVPSNDYIFLGVGSDEIIDLLMRVSCTPGLESGDKIITTPPTYGMYGVTAAVNDVGIVKVPLNVEEGKFEVDLPALEAAVKQTPNAKLIFLCSPGNPTGTLIPLETIRKVCENPDFRGLVVVDEAYIDFSPEGTSAVALIEEFSNLVVMQTLSKGFGLAAIRLGICFAQPPLIQILNNTKAPYTVSSTTAYLAESALSAPALKQMRANVDTLIANRTNLITEIVKLPGIGKVLGGNDANFILVQILSSGAAAKPDSKRAKKVYTAMAEEMGVVVRFRGSEFGCEGCVRISIGSEEECKTVLEKLRLALEKY